MAMKSQHLQAMFARRREQEHMHTERTQAVNKYYDHWGKVTSRFENWTTPEYYKQADEKLQRTKDDKEKEKQLIERREKLAQLMDFEKEQYDLELKQKQSSRKSRAVNTTTLEKINENLKEQQTIRRKLELEAKLYGKWRHGVDDANLIFESKSDHEVIAKLNWLDKQVENQLEREKDEIEAKERDVRLQAEQNRAEELHKERQQIREQEIREIRSLQEMHMDQLKEHQKESDILRDREQKLRENLDELDKELELLDESYTVLQQHADFGSAYNLNKIKVFMRKRSEVYRSQIKLCISILERTLAYASRPESLQALRVNLAKQLDTEMYALSQIDAMYESEAKYNLHRCEELWQTQNTERYKELKELLNLERNFNDKLLNDVVRREHELIDIRSTHLSAIENTSEKLKQLIREEEESPRGCSFSPRGDEEDAGKSVTFSPRHCTSNTNKTDNSPRSGEAARAAQESQNSTRHPITSSRSNAAQQNASGGFSSNRYDDHITNTFHDLNLDALQSVPSSPRELDNQRMDAQRTLRVVTSDTAERPKFGRKRVAWN